MDHLHAALKKKIGDLHKMVGGDMPGDDSHSALHDQMVGQVGHKPDDGKDPKLDSDQDHDHESKEREEQGLAPKLDDDPKHILEGGGDKDAKLLSLGHKSSLGVPDPGHDGELAMLKGLSGGGAIGRDPQSLGERVKAKMQERMKAIQATKKRD